MRSEFGDSINIGENRFPVSAIVDQTPSLRDIVPEAPGVYIFQDGKGSALYVGKAINLRRRLISYGRPPLPLKVASLMGKAKSFEFIVTRNEKEALLLEAQLIKKFRPPYNVVLRDDKNYPAIRINLREPFPRLEMVRRVKRDGAFYFGPYPSPHAMNEVVKILRKAFPLRKCPGKTFMKRNRPCLNHDLGLCLAPCVGKISRKQYDLIVRDLIKFLSGDDRILREKLMSEMLRASEQLEFEKAAVIRDRLFALDALMERQAVVSHRRINRDVVGYFSDSGHASVSVVYVRGGVITGHKNFDVSSASGDEAQIITTFLSQYYDIYPFIPEEILLPVEIEESEELEQYLTELRGAPVEIICGTKDEEDRELLEIAQANAREHSRAAASHLTYQQENLQILQNLLGLDFTPATIACVDISNLQGKHTVGAVVVFKKGVPVPKWYRTYLLGEFVEQNDPVMIQTTIEKLAGEDPAVFEEIDLLMVDGGKTQLQGALKALEAIDSENDTSLQSRPALIAIAKERSLDSRLERLEAEKIYLPQKSEPILLADHPEARKLLQTIRDEAHRCALGAYQREHRRSLKTSVLDAIRGVGSKRKKLLLKHFGDVEAISRARLEDLLAIPGIPEDVARNIYEFFHPS